MRAPPLIDIHYLRPPDREQIFTQHLIWDAPDVKITFAVDLSLELPLRIGDGVVLESGSEVIWFTFPGAWHDIGLFHLADGTFTGTYANILTPCGFEEDGTWRTTDLFLDVWKDLRGETQVLDEEELRDAEARGWVSEAVAVRARAEALALKQQAEEGLWPPAVVKEWTLDRARERLP